MMTAKEYRAALIERANILTAAEQAAPVIGRWIGSKETAEWAAWVTYWTAIKAYGTLAMIADRAVWTVPTQFPWEI